MTELNTIFSELCKECYNHKFNNLKYLESDITVDDILSMKNGKNLIATLNLCEDYSDIRCVVGKVETTLELYKLINDINNEANFVKCVIEKEYLVIKYCVMTVCDYSGCALILRDALDEIVSITNELDFNIVFN